MLPPKAVSALDEAEKPKIDPDFEEVTEGEEVQRKEKLKTKWPQLEAIVGSEKRLKLIARDIVEHFDQRLEAMDGKALVVCMSRRICVELYNELAKLRPERASPKPGYHHPILCLESAIRRELSSSPCVLVNLPLH